MAATMGAARSGYGSAGAARPRRIQAWFMAKVS
jgi:hypothetical protein